MVALESALPPLRVAAKRLQFTPNSSKAKSAVAGGGSKSQLLADIALEGAVSCSTDVASGTAAAAGTLKRAGDHVDGGGASKKGEHAC